MWIGTGQYHQLEWPQGQPPIIGRSYDKAYRVRKLRPEPTKPFDLSATGFANPAKLSLADFSDRHKSVAARTRCWASIPIAKAGRFGQTILDPAERAIFEKCRSGLLPVSARTSETDPTSAVLQSSYFDCPVAINAWTGNLEFDRSSPIETYFKWRHGEGLSRYGPRVGVDALQNAFPCKTAEPKRRNGSGRRAATATDRRNFVAWGEMFLADEGRPPSREEYFAWADENNLSQAFVRHMMREVPGTLKLARGVKR
jgi:hypothetical protein